MNIGYFLKKIRTDKSLTLNEVANKTQMTASLISQIENEKVYPSLNSLEAILHYYGIELSNFFEQVEGKNYILTKCFNTPKIESKSEVDIYTLSPFIYESKIEWVYIEIQPEKKFEVVKSAEKIKLNENEMKFIFLISGKITIELGTEKFKMTTDDTLCFKSILPVTIINSSPTKAKLILSGKQLVIK